MGMDIDELEEMYDGTADNRGALKRDYDDLKAENEKLKKQLARPSSEGIALKLVEIFDRRAEGSASGDMICPHASIGVAYTGVRIFDTTIWDTEDDHTPPDWGNETVTSALVHCEDAIRDIIAALQALLVEDDEEEDEAFVVVNGKVCGTDKGTLSFDDLLSLADNTSTPGEYVISFRWSKDNECQLILAPSDTVEARDGMVFTVARKDDS